MATIVDEPTTYTTLRDKAEARLKEGTAPATGRLSMGVDALRLLHQLSSNPDSADNALKLLHELQVHQVELELQHEEITANEQALAEDMSFYRELYDAAPLSYFLVDSEGIVMRGNLAAAELFGVDQDDLPGQRIDTLLSPESRPQLSGLLQRVTKSSTRGACVAEENTGTAPPRRLLLLASRSPQHEHIQLACCEQTGAG